MTLSDAYLHLIQEKFLKNQGNQAKSTIQRLQGIAPVREEISRKSSEIGNNSRRISPFFETNTMVKA
jgi:hypothetical protein